MANSNGVISAPVRLTQDIFTVLGSGRGLAYCYAHGTVNKWALHKPVRLITGYDTPTIPQSEWLNYMKTKVRETDNNVLAPYALKVTPSINLYEVVGLSSAPAVDWVYQQPSESGSFWRRMLDVNRYARTANTPMVQPTAMNYYNDSTNVLMIDTNDGEAGDTSIQVSSLTQLASYRLMVAVKLSSTQWAFAVMSSVISQSVIDGSISFNLPRTGAYQFTPGTYDAYVVGLTTSASVQTNIWMTCSDSIIRSFYGGMIPLPFANKANCKFRFKVQSVAPTNVVYLSYTLYLRRSDYRVMSIEFWAEKYQATISGFVLSVTNIVVHDDGETMSVPLSGAVATLNNFSYDSTTRRSIGSKTIDVSGYEVNAGDYPNITYQTSNNGGYTVEWGGSNVVFID